MTSSIDMRQVSKRWGWILADGILGVIVGLIALVVSPIATVLVLAIFLGLGLLISGIIEATVALRVRHAVAHSSWTVVFGVLTALAGILVLFRPATGIVIMVVGLLLWFLIAGINDLFVAARSTEHRGWNIAMGVLALLAAVILLFNFEAAVLTIALLAGFGFLLRGASEIGLALSLRRASR